MVSGPPSRKYSASSVNSSSDSTKRHRDHDDDQRRHHDHGDVYAATGMATAVIARSGGRGGIVDDGANTIWVNIGWAKLFTHVVYPS